jgi:hypothetical protein
MTLAKKSMKKDKNGGKIRVEGLSARPVTARGPAVAKRESVIILHK